MSTDETELIRKKWTRNRILWVHGLGSATLLGIAHSITPVVVDPQTFNLTTGFHKLLTMVVASGVLGAFTYLAKSPLPALPKELEQDEVPGSGTP